jgi:hypothetical protein
MTAALTLFHSYPAGYSSGGGSQLLPGSTIALGLFLWLTVAPYS